MSGYINYINFLLKKKKVFILKKYFKVLKIIIKTSENLFTEVGLIEGMV